MKSVPGLRVATLCVATFLGALSSSGCATTPISYLDQDVPGSSPVLFAPGIVNTDAIELNGVFLPDGSQFFFTRVVDGVFTIHRCVRGEGERGGWGAPEPLYLFPGGEPGLAVDMAASPDSQKLYFLGQFASELFPESPGLDLWVSEREGTGWGTARPLAPPITTNAAEFYPCVVADGSLYYISDGAGSLGSTDIYRAQIKADGSFEDPVNIGAPVNTENGEGDTYVAPDESYMILTSSRGGGLGQGDLYFSFRKADGTWSDAVNLGGVVNSEHTDFCPMVTPDGKYFFFSRRYGNTWNDSERCEIYWMDTTYFEFLRGAQGEAETTAL